MTTFFDDLRKAYDPNTALERGNVRNYYLNDADTYKVSNDVHKLIVNANKKVMLFINGPLPEFLTYDSDKVIRAISDVSDRVEVKILLKRDRGSEEVDDLINRLKDTGYRWNLDIDADK